MSEDEVDARLSFLRRRLSAERRYAARWWSVWVGVYSAGVVAQSVRMGMATTAADRADLMISSIKAMGGVLRLGFMPMNGIEDMPESGCAGACSHARKLALLRRAEGVLERNARRVERSRAWWGHLLNLGVNAGGAAVVAFVYGAPKTAAVSAAIGAGVGEVMLFTQPAAAPEDLADYRAGLVDRPRPTLPPVRWRVSPLGAGAAVEVAF